MQDLKIKNNWVKLPNLEDIYLNLVCMKCGKKLEHELNFVVYDNNFGIFGNHCREVVFSEHEGANRVNISSLDMEILCSLMDKQNITKFIHEKDLYLNFSVMVKNYRDKPGFCNL